MTDLFVDRLDGLGVGHDSQRAAAAAVLAAFVRRHPDGDGQSDPRLLEVIVKALVRGLTDQSVRVRKVSRG